jgi:hypothetical protein
VRLCLNPTGCATYGRDFVFPQIAAGHLDVAVVCELPVAKLALGDQFEAGPLKVVCLQAALRRDGAVQKPPEDLARHSDRPFVLPDSDPELDR